MNLVDLGSEICHVLELLIANVRLELIKTVRPITFEQLLPRIRFGIATWFLST